MQKVLYALLVIIPLAAIYLLVSCQGSTSEKGAKSKPISNVIHPDWSVDANIYEVNTRQFTPEGTFEAFRQHLPRLQNMGVEILWFMPIHPIGEKNRKGTLGSYYAVRDYKGINPEFGTFEDFKAIVDEAHSLGMKVIIDWVANHTAWDHPWTEEHPDWYTRDSLGNLVSPFDWSDVVGLNYESTGLRDAMIDALKFWVREADIDGYRCDVAGLVPVDFWDRARKELDAIKPVFMLAEAEEQELTVHAFDADYAWEMHHILNKMAIGEKNVDDLWSYFRKNDTVYAKNTYRMYFTSNHDENSWNGTEYERMGEGAQAFAVLCATVPGIPLIYNGQEAALDKRLEFFEKDTIQWGDYALQDFYGKLLFLKKEHPSLWNGEAGGSLARINSNYDKEVLAFARVKEKDVILVIINLSPEGKAVAWKPKFFSGHYQEVFSGGHTELNDSAEVELGPWDYKVFVKEP